MKVVAALLMLAFVSVLSAESIYIGSDKCAKMCHKAAAKGEQLPIWEKSKHANAYKTLATPAALEVAKKAGITGDPQKADQCLKCHVTAFGVDAKLKDATYKIEDGVGCESCHGAGKDYSKLTIMKDKAKSIAAGLIVPDEKVCIKCHNAESPNYKKFNYAEMVKKIEHKVPAAKK